jgi:uncharacterized protein YjbI with pentapeptide repeats
MTRAEPELSADCGRCMALCCVAPGFTKSADFAISKRPGEPCPHLEQNFGCGIHDRLRPSGFPGCTVFDCFGAGQQVTQVTFAGRDWRSHPEQAGAMFASFAVMRQLHELRWHVDQALTLTEDLADGQTEDLAEDQTGDLGEDLGGSQLRTELMQADQTLRGHADSSPAALAALDVDPLWVTVTALLRRASQLIRGEVPPGRERSGADLMGRHLAGVDLRRASLRGAYLIGTNLAGADLRLADLAGADLRGAQLAGADLSSSLFVTQAQLDAARGDVRTKLPPARRRPAHWLGRAPASGGGR